MSTGYEAGVGFRQLRPLIILGKAGQVAAQ